MTAEAEATTVQAEALPHGLVSGVLAVVRTPEAGTLIVRQVGVLLLCTTPAPPTHAVARRSRRSTENRLRPSSRT